MRRKNIVLVRWANTARALIKRHFDASVPPPSVVNSNRKIRYICEHVYILFGIDTDDKIWAKRLWRVLCNQTSWIETDRMLSKMKIQDDHSKIAGLLYTEKKYVDATCPECIEHNLEWLQKNPASRGAFGAAIKKK